MKICVIIPVHNEASTIGYLVETLRKSNYNVVVIVDGCTDKSKEIAIDKGAVVISNETRLGKGKSMHKGFQYAVESGYDGVITMDGDGQHSPEDMKNFISEIEESSSIVIVGNRMDNPRSMPLIRFLTNKIMSAIISVICKQKVPDSQCGYRYIGCDVLKNIKLQCCDFEIETEVLIKSSRKGYKIKSVPVKTIYSNEKSKISAIRDTVRFFKYLAKEISGG